MVRSTLLVPLLVLGLGLTAPPGRAAPSSAEVAAAAPSVVAHAVRMPTSPTDPVQPPPVRLPVSAGRPVAGYTAWPGNMPYYGGPVLRRPRVYVVFWGWPRDKDDPSARVLADFLRGVGGSPWLGVATQYYDVDGAGRRHPVTNPRNQLGGVWWDPSRPPKDHYAETLIGPEAVRAARHFGVLGDRDAVVLVASPRDRNPASFVDGVYCAWHSWTNGLAFINLPYVLNVNCGERYVEDDFDAVTLVAGHEYLEAITDPAVGFDPAWRDVTWEENADKCEWIPPGLPGGALMITLPTGRFAVQQTWSNAALAGAGDCAAG
jgi:hypothetical protein